MISWMQKHNKYLIVTIWIATIAFIGAGFVGWGSYQYGSKSGTVGKVGDIEIPQEKLNLTYQNLYERFREMFKGQFDEAKAKEMGLAQQAFNSLAAQAQLLNLAKEYGIVVSEKEIGEYIASIEGFHEDGAFSKVVYKTYLKNRRLKAKTFESILKDELIVGKLMGLLGQKALPFETEIIASALSIADKIAYTVLTPGQMLVDVSEQDAQAFWEKTKENYKTKQAYELAILWTDSKDVNVTEQELKAYHAKNSFNYKDAQGKEFSYEKAKLVALQDLKIKRSKKQALRDYIALKKQEKKPSETKTIMVGSPELGNAMWEMIAQAKMGDILKPKVVGSRYATVQVIKSIPPVAKDFTEAKAEVIARLTKQKKIAMLQSKAEAALKSIDTADLNSTDWISVRKYDNMTPLSKEETLQFLQKLFTSSDKKGMITVSQSVVVYKVIEQRINDLDSNLSGGLQDSVDRIKRNVFEANLFKVLNEKFPAEAFVKF